MQIGLGEMPGEEEGRKDAGATVRRVRRVFLIALALNIAVALAKAIFGLLADVHIAVDAALPVAEAHAIPDEVERRLKETVPGLVEVVVHIEPERSP